MKNFLTAYDLANNIRMTRSLHKGAFLLVEGSSDMRVYERFVDKDHCMVMPGFGRSKVIQTLEILENDNFKGILAIVDSDFSELDGIKPTSPNLFFTDTHDLETMIIKSKALYKVLDEYASTKELKKIDKPIEEVIVESGLPIGYFRWLCTPKKFNLVLKFKYLPFDNFLDRKTLEVDIEKLIKEVKINSENFPFDERLIKREIKTLISNNNYDPWKVCSGHDLVEILTIGLKYTFGNKRAKELTPEIVSGILRISYEYEHFQETLLYISITNWEKDNLNFKVLKI